jgi:outer membrane protein assembly factor BamB
MIFVSSLSPPALIALRASTGAPVWSVPFVSNMPRVVPTAQVGVISAPTLAYVPVVGRPVAAAVLVLFDDKMYAFAENGAPLWQTATGSGLIGLNAAMSCAAPTVTSAGQAIVAGGAGVAAVAVSNGAVTGVANSTAAGFERQSGFTRPPAVTADLSTMVCVDDRHVHVFRTNPLREAASYGINNDGRATLSAPLVDEARGVWTVLAAMPVTAGSSQLSGFLWTGPLNNSGIATRTVLPHGLPFGALDPTLRRYHSADTVLNLADGSNVTLPLRGAARWMADGSLLMVGPRAASINGASLTIGAFQGI